MNFDFEPVYPRHDLLIEIGLIEMAMEHLAVADEPGRGEALRPRLETRINHLRDALEQLAA